MPLIREDRGRSLTGRKEDFKGAKRAETPTFQPAVFTCPLAVHVNTPGKIHGEPGRTALRADPSGRPRRVYLARRDPPPSFPPTRRRDPFFPLQPGRRSGSPRSLARFTPSLFRYRSNFPLDVRRDFRESKDPFSKDPILSRLSGTREPGLSRPLPPFLFPLPFVASATLLSIHSRSQTTETAFFCVESTVLLGSVAYYGCIYGRSYDRYERNPDCRSGLLDDFQNIYIVLRG